MPDPTKQDSSLKKIEDYYLHKVRQKTTCSGKDLSDIFSVYDKYQDIDFILNVLESATKENIRRNGKCKINSFSYFIPILEDRWKEMSEDKEVGKMEQINISLNQIQERLISLQKKMQKGQESYHYNCNICKDQGFIFKNIDGYEVASKCKCKLKEEILSKSNNSGLGNLFKTRTFETYRTEEDYQRVIKSKAIKFTKEF